MCPNNGWMFTGRWREKDGAAGPPLPDFDGAEQRMSAGARFGVRLSSNCRASSIVVFAGVGDADRWAISCSVHEGKSLVALRNILPGALHLKGFHQLGVFWDRGKRLQLSEEFVVVVLRRAEIVSAAGDGIVDASMIWLLNLWEFESGVSVQRKEGRKKSRKRAPGEVRGGMDIMETALLGSAFESHSRVPGFLDRRCNGFSCFRRGSSGGANSRTFKVVVSRGGAESCRRQVFASQVAFKTCIELQSAFFGTRRYERKTSERTAQFSAPTFSTGRCTWTGVSKGGFVTNALASSFPSVTKAEKALSLPLDYYQVCILWFFRSTIHGGCWFCSLVSCFQSFICLIGCRENSGLGGYISVVGFYLFGVDSSIT